MFGIVGHPADLEAKESALERAGELLRRDLRGHQAAAIEFREVEITWDRSISQNCSGGAGSPK